MPCSLLGLAPGVRNTIAITNYDIQFSCVGLQALGMEITRAALPMFYELLLMIYDS